VLQVSSHWKYCIQNIYRFEALTAVITCGSIFWDITPCCLVKVNWRFGGIFRPFYHEDGGRLFFETSGILRTTQHYNSKSHSLQFTILFILPKIYRRNNCDLNSGARIFSEQSLPALSFSYLFVVTFFWGGNLRGCAGLLQARACVDLPFRRIQPRRSGNGECLFISCHWLPLSTLQQAPGNGTMTVTACS
jgi:hypothetical protein